VCASQSMPDELVATLEPWDLNALEGFRPEFLSGFKTERYAVGLEDGFARARDIMDGTIRQLCREDIGGDHQRLDEVKTKHLGVTFKHLLLPVWVASYRYRDKLFQILVNARTGEVVGRRPYSVAKIVSLIAAVVVLALLAWFLIARAQGGQPPRPRGGRAVAARGLAGKTPPAKPQAAHDPGRAYAAMTALADRSPSTAALTMPPAYPAPSPTGYNPSTPGDARVTGSRTIRTGELPRASGPASTAPGRNLPCQRRSIRGCPSATAVASIGCSTSRRSTDTTPRG